MNKSTSAFVPCGLEISARTLVMDLQGHDPREFDNTPTGHQAVRRALERLGRPVRVCLEATGLYGLDLALTLHAAGVALMVANPRAVRHFATALMQRSKTDRLDARVLREYAARMPFQPWQPPSPQAVQLMGLTHRLQGLTQMMTAEKNRLHAATLSRALPAAVRYDLAHHLRNLQHSVERLTHCAQELVLADPDLARRYELLLSIPGVGPTSALRLLAELLHLGPDLDVRQWVAYAGLDPRQYTSGTSVAQRPRISKAGNVHLRRALYMPALVATQHQPQFRAFYLHLIGRGKAKMQALVAVMRKLLHAIFGMFKHDQLFDGRKLSASTEAVCA